MPSIRRRDSPFIVLLIWVRGVDSVGAVLQHWSVGVHFFLIWFLTGHVEVVKLLVSRSADKSCKDKQGYTPLHAAAASGHLEIVKYLLRMGAEVNVGFSWRFTRQNTQRSLWICFDSRLFTPQIDEPNGFGNTALHVACYMGQEAVATELVNHGANVNQPNKCGYTPLHLAAVSTNGALCLELLVNNGADVNQQVWNWMIDGCRVIEVCDFVFEARTKCKCVCFF